MARRLQVILGVEEGVGCASPANDAVEALALPSVVLDPVTSGRTARLIGSVFGLVFIMVNAGMAGSPWSWVFRGAGVVAATGVGWALARRPETDLEPRTAAVRVYWWCVVAEVVALFAGTRLLDANGHGEYGVAWVAFVVGLHFLPFSWAWRHPEFRWLGIALMTLATIGAVLGVIGAGDASIALVAGVGSGFVLLGYAGAGGRSAGSSSRSVPGTGGAA